MSKLRVVGSKPAAAWLLGFLVGSLVNAAGVAVWVSGMGGPGYWVPVTAALLVGVVSAISPRLRWLGLGLAAGCVGEALVLVGLVLVWGTVAGSAVS